MRWMKHMTAAWQDEKIARMIDEGGIESYGFYWRMLEIVAANMTETSNPVCQLPAKSWARLCNLLSNRFERLSQLLAKCGLCRLDTFEGLLKVEFPNLVKYRDEYSKKRGKVDDKNLDKVRSVSGYCPEQEQIQIQKEKQNTETKHKQKKSSSEKKPPFDHESFLAECNELERYWNLNVWHEGEKMAAWLEDHPGRKWGKSFMINWLDRAAKDAGPLLDEYGFPAPSMAETKRIGEEVDQLIKAEIAKGNLHPDGSQLTFKERIALCESRNPANKKQ